MNFLKFHHDSKGSLQCVLILWVCWGGVWLVSWNSPAASSARFLDAIKLFEMLKDRNVLRKILERSCVVGIRPHYYSMAAHMQHFWNICLRILFATSRQPLLLSLLVVCTNSHPHCWQHTLGKILSTFHSCPISSPGHCQISVDIYGKQDRTKSQW